MTTEERMMNVIEEALGERLGYADHFRTIRDREEGVHVGEVDLPVTVDGVEYLVSVRRMDAEAN